MSHFPNYHVHSCSFCHNHSLLLVLLSPTPACLLDSMSDPALNPMLSPMLDPTPNLMLTCTLSLTTLTSPLLHFPMNINERSMNCILKDRKSTRLNSSHTV